MNAGRIAAVALLAMVLAGCGGGSKGYSDAASVAKAAGCTSAKNTEPEAYVADAVACRFGGHDTTVNWFKDGGSKSTWLKVAGSFGGEIASGSDWAIECESKADCVAMAKSAGGSVQ